MTDQHGTASDQAVSEAVSEVLTEWAGVAAALYGDAATGAAGADAHAADEAAANLWSGLGGSTRRRRSRS